MVNASTSIHITFEKWCVEHQFHICSVTSQLCFHLVFSANQMTLCPPKTLDLLGLRLHVPLNRSFLSEMTDWNGTNEVWPLFVISAKLKIKLYNAHMNITSIYFIYILFEERKTLRKNSIHVINNMRSVWICMWKASMPCQRQCILGLMFCRWHLSKLNLFCTHVLLTDSC